MLMLDELDELERQQHEQTATDDLTARNIPEDVAAELKHLRAETQRLQSIVSETLGHESTDELTMGNGCPSEPRHEVFCPREPADPLSTWFPLKHTLDKEKQFTGCVLCMGPPSSTASDWTAPIQLDFADDRGYHCLQPEAKPPGLDLSQNPLVQHCTHKRAELLVLQIPAHAVDSGMHLVAQKLAVLLRRKLKHVPFEILSVSVGVWLAAAFMNELKALDAELWKQCYKFIVVGFPPPTAPLTRIPAGMSHQDVAFARSLSTFKPKLPCPCLVHYFPACDNGWDKATILEWKEYKQKDAVHWTTWPEAGLAGDMSCLSVPTDRHDFFWAITRYETAVGMGGKANPRGVRRRSIGTYRDSCLADGCPPVKRPLFDDVDAWLLELQSKKHMRAIQRHYACGMKPCFLADVFCMGQCGVDNGIDLRIFADMSTEGCLEENNGKGCKTVSLARFGWRSAASVCPATSATVHGGAIGAVMEESAANCMNFWITESSSTRKIEHRFVKPVIQYQTYWIDCSLEGFTREGMSVDFKVVMKDLLGVCVVTKAQFVDARKTHSDDVDFKW